MKHIKKLFGTLIIPALLQVSAVTAPAGAIVYCNDFENSVGPECSAQHRIQTPGGSRPQTWFLGGDINGNNRGFADDTVTLTLTNLAPHTWVEITFDLYIINSWDGSSGPAGPDYFLLAVQGGPLLLNTTFANTGAPQSYPADAGAGSYPSRTAALENNSLGWDGSLFGNAVYRITRRVQSTASAIQFQFLGGVNEPDGYNETWGLDNVSISADVAPDLSCVTAPSGLVRWWPGDGDATDIAGGANGSLQGDVGFAPGKVGQALSFGGVDGLVFGQTGGHLPPNNTFTIEFWAFPNASRAETPESNSGVGGAGGQRYAIAPTGPLGTDARAGISVGNNGISVFEYGVGYLPSLLVYNASITDWTHMAVVYENKQPRLYVNGILVRVGLTSTRSVILAGEEFGNPRSAGYGEYSGLLDEVSVYNRALAWNEIAAIYNAHSTAKCGLPAAVLFPPPNETVLAGGSATFGATVAGTLPLSYQWRLDGTNIATATNSSYTVTSAQPGDVGGYSVIVSNSYGSATSSVAILKLTTNTFEVGMVAYYPFNGNANDESGKGNNGAVDGAVLTKDRLGEPNSAYDFNGSNSVIAFSSPPLSQVDNWTLSAWINPAHLSQLGVPLLVGFDNGGWGNGYGFGFDGSSDLKALFSGLMWFSPGYSMPAAKRWYHVVMLRQTGTTRVFVDGTESANTSSTTPLAPTSFTIGSASGFRFFNGQVDDVRIYNRALSASEVRQLHAIESFCSPHQPQANATLSGDGVVAATMLDYGCGYTNAPSVRIVGGGGSGATAMANMLGGIVADIVITSAGSGYTNAPRILFESPPFAPTVSIAVSKINVTQRVRVNHNYVLEASSDLTAWTATGPAFTAESESIVTEFPVDSVGKYFRLREVP